MNPGQPKSEQPKLNLPELSLESPKLGVGPAKPEMDYQIPKPMNPVGNDTNVVQATPLNPAIGLNPTGNSSASPTTKDTALTQLPHVAGDLDLMEKEWMIKAKHLLAKNRKNPHEQAREIGLLKADYLKKRFNKELNVKDG